jgi:hypothetical protein
MQVAFVMMSRSKLVVPAYDELTRCYKTSMTAERGAILFQ